MHKRKEISYVEKNDIFIIHGTDYKNMAKRILGQAGVVADISDVSKRVTLEPNLVTAKAPSSGVTTHSGLLTGVIEYLQEHGFQDITIMESSWAGDHMEDAFRTAGYHQVYSRYSIPFVDLQRDTWKEYDAGGIEIRLCDKAAAVDYMISTPVLGGHYQATMTYALKNSGDVIPNSEKRRFHTLELRKPIAYLNTITHNDFILVDNVYGDSNFEEGGNLTIMNRVLGLKNPVLCDAFVCNCMGYSVDSVPYITMARSLGVGNTDTAYANMICPDRATEAHSEFRMARHVQHLAAHTAPEGVCSACYGSFIYTLGRLSDMGCLRKDLPPVCIGQGYKGREGAIGVGQCTSYFAKTLGDCPPKTADIMEFLGSQWQ